MERQKVLVQLKAAGKIGTPVNPETFAAWQEQKRLARQADIKRRVETELRKKKGGKGLSVLSGRDLYEYRKELFTKMDDEDDNNAIYNYNSNDNDNNGNDNENTISKQQQQQSSIGTSENGNDDNKNGTRNGTIQNCQDGTTNDTKSMDQVASKIQSDLFLQGDDEDLDEIDDD
jgi:DRG Family Regulatory Proteins, Tma46